MQAIPTMPAEMTPAPVQANSVSTSDPGSSGENFQAHLRTAHTRNDKQEPVATQKMRIKSPDKLAGKRESWHEKTEEIASGQMALVAGQGNIISLPHDSAQSLAARNTGTNLPSTTGSSVTTLLAAITGEEQPASSPDLALTLLEQKTTGSTNRPGNHLSPDITVEHWSATFKNIAGQQNTHGQLPTDQALSEEEVLLDETSFLFGKSHGTSRRQDTTGQYIHSNLPTGLEQAARQPAVGGQNLQHHNGRQTGGEDTLAADHLHNRISSQGKDTGLIFTLAQSNGESVASSQATGQTQAGTAKLPSGIMVPENHIVGQVVERFSMNQRLETGTVTLRLYPQELGELRMEIKVEQDNIKAHITTQNPQVQEILEKNMPRLRDALEQQGMNLEQMEVSVAASDQNDSRPFQENSASHDQSGSLSPSRRASADFASLLDDEAEVVQVTAPQSLSVHA